MFAKSNTAKQLSLQASLQTLEHFKHVKFLSVNKCSRTRMGKFRLVSQIYTEFNPAQVNLYTTQKRSDLGTES